MSEYWTRREMLRQGLLGMTGLAALGIPESVWSLQQGEELVNFTDYTDQFKIEFSEKNPRVRCFDLRRLTSWTTPNNEFYAFNKARRNGSTPPNGGCASTDLSIIRRNSRWLICSAERTSARKRSHSNVPETPHGRTG